MSGKISELTEKESESYYDDLEGESQISFIKVKCESLLSRQYVCILPLVVILYILFQSLAYYFHACSGIVYIQNWTERILIVIAILFGLSTAYHSSIYLSLILSKNSDELSYPSSIFAAAAVVSLIAGVSTYIKINDNYQSVCVDALGMESFSSTWPEWLVEVPLLGK